MNGRSPSLVGMTGADTSQWRISLRENFNVWTLDFNLTRVWLECDDTVTSEYWSTSKQD